MHEHDVSTKTESSDTDVCAVHLGSLLVFRSRTNAGVVIEARVLETYDVGLQNSDVMDQSSQTIFLAAQEFLRWIQELGGGRSGLTDWRAAEISKEGGRNAAPPTRCEQNTHSNSMYRCAQCVTTHTEQIDHISSREHAWLKSWKAQDCTSLCPKNNCHLRVMSHSLPHLMLTTSTSSLSLASPIFVGNASDSMRLDQAKDRSIQKYLETSSKYGILVQFKARSGERIAILPNTAVCI